MKQITLLGVVISTVLLVACSDFFNSSKSSDNNPTGGGEKVTGNKPFPADYDPNIGVFTEEKLLANVGLNVIVPATQNLRLQTEILSLELQQWLRSKNSDQKLALQTQWKKTMMAFHFLDGAPIGPLSDKNLRVAEQIYSWPYSNFCGVDHEVLKLSLKPNDVKVPSLFTLKGLSVLEYLLFEKDLGSQCNANNVRNKPVIEWTKKSASEKETDRMQYAALITRDLIEQTRQLEGLWNPQTNNYTMSLVDGSLYGSPKDAVNALSDSLFSVEKVKDIKMAKPLGLHKECTSDSKKCPESVEHSWSGLSFEAMEAQVQGFETVFMGLTSNKDGFGFDDYLISMGHEQVAQTMKNNLDIFLSSLQEMKKIGTFREHIEQMDAVSCAQTTLENKKVPVCALYQELRLITTKMKTEFLVALSLKSPPTYQGDND